MFAEISLEVYGYDKGVCLNKIKIAFNGINIQELTKHQIFSCKVWDISVEYLRW